MEYLNRKNYVNQLNMWRDKRVVKVRARSFCARDKSITFRMSG